MIDLDSNFLRILPSKHVVQMFWSLWKAFLVLSLLILSISRLQSLMKIGPVLNISDLMFTLNSPLVPCVLSSVNVKPTGVLKLACGFSNLTW